jgi:proline dehydrogenase
VGCAIARAQYDEAASLPPSSTAKRSGGTLKTEGTGSPALLDVIRLRRASTYGAGPGLDQAIDVCRRLAAYGIASVIGYSPSPGEPARVVTDVHLAAFDRLSAEGLDCYVSVKLSGIGFDAALFAELTAAAARSGRRLHADALKAETADATLRLLEGAPRPGPFGTTLPGRWRRSLADSSRAVGLGLSLRVVKGHWADDLGGSVDPAKGFLDVVDQLCGYQGGVAVATHNVRLLRDSLRRLTASGTPCEAELLLGLPFRGPATAAERFGVPVRVYVPYGDAWPGYGVRDLVGHPTTAWWLVQDLLFGKDKTWRSIRRSRPKP